MYETKCRYFNKQKKLFRHNSCGRVDESSPGSSLDIIKANFKAQGVLTTLTQITDTESYNWICVTLDVPSQL